MLKADSPLESGMVVTRHSTYHRSAPKSGCFLGDTMTTRAKLYYLAAGLALTAAAITAIKDGFAANGYFYVGFLVAVAVVLYWLGSRERMKAD